MLELIVLVHNYCTDYVGFNQMNTVFDPDYVIIENIEGYDWISQYYFQPGDYSTDDNEQVGHDSDIGSIN